MNDPRLWIATLSGPRSSVENSIKTTQSAARTRGMSCVANRLEQTNARGQNYRHLSGHCHPPSTDGPTRETDDDHIPDRAHSACSRARPGEALGVADLQRRSREPTARGWSATAPRMPWFHLGFPDGRLTTRATAAGTGSPTRRRGRSGSGSPRPLRCRCDRAGRCDGTGNVSRETRSSRTLAGSPTSAPRPRNRAAPHPCSPLPRTPRTIAPLAHCPAAPPQAGRANPAHTRPPRGGARSCKGETPPPSATLTARALHVKPQRRRAFR
jgi:hypothetical protein